MHKSQEPDVLVVKVTRLQRGNESPHNEVRHLSVVLVLPHLWAQGAQPVPPGGDVVGVRTLDDLDHFLF